jgi:hypothetical protein
MMYGKAILGDNQFLGVNHANQAKATELYARFKHPDAILKVIGAAYDAGVRDFMFTTHDRYDLLFHEIHLSKLFPGMYYTPCVPYAHKYWNQLSDMGPSALLASTVLKINPLRIAPALLSLFFGKKNGVVRILTEIEMLMCRGLPLRGVFLQNLAFDFLMAMELNGIIESFADTVIQRFGILPGFITMNHTKAVETLCNQVGMERPWICANYNLASFRMNPSLMMVEESFATHKSNNIAMSVLASGHAKPSEAMEYVISRMGSGGIDAILFGSSSPENIKTNVFKIMQS